MRHYFEIDGQSMHVDMNCKHPERQDNTCPISSSDCGSCKHCEATMSAKDWFDLYKSVLK